MKRTDPPRGSGRGVKEPGRRPAVGRYLLRRTLQLGVVALLALAYGWTGRIGEATPEAYLAALGEATRGVRSTRAHCLVPRLFDLKGPEDWAMPDGLGRALEEVGWTMYRDTLPADSSVVLWRVFRARPASLMDRLTPVRFEPFGAYLHRFLPGTYHAVEVMMSVTLVGSDVHTGSTLGTHVVRCWRERCRSLGEGSLTHLDGWSRDTYVYRTGRAGSCAGTLPPSHPDPDRWW